MVDAIIIDDEQHCIDRLIDLLDDWKKEVTISATYGNVDDAVAAIRKNPPDLIFLDVQLGPGSAFDLLEQVHNVPLNVIFTTAWEQYAVRAFQFAALDYLLKPVTRADFDRAVSRVIKDTLSGQMMEHLQVLMQNISQTEKPQKISIPTEEGYVFLAISDIIRCNSDVNYTHIYTIMGKKYTAAKTLKHFEELLTPSNFFRVHYSHLINMSFVEKYHRGKGGMVTLKDGTEVEVSTRRKDALLKKLGAC